MYFTLDVSFPEKNSHFETGNSGIDRDVVEGESRHSAQFSPLFISKVFQIDSFISSSSQATHSCIF